MEKKKIEHKTGFHVYLYGRKFWHRLPWTATDRARKAADYCRNPQVIEVETGKLIYGRPE